MPVRKGKFLYNVRRRPGEPLTDEQAVFLDCIEDVMRSTPGLEYGLYLDPDEIRSRDQAAFALFVIVTNPTYNLTVALELAERQLVVHVNGLAFPRRRGRRTRFEWWIERRCLEIERLLSGELRTVQRSVLGIPVVTTLEFGRDGTWRKIATNENPLLSILSFLLPYGFLTGGERTRVYTDWYLDGPADPAATPPPPPPRPEKR